MLMISANGLHEPAGAGLGFLLVIFALALGLWLKAGKVRPFLSQPGLNVTMFLSNVPWTNPIVLASFSEESTSYLLAWLWDTPFRAQRLTLLRTAFAQRSVGCRARLRLRSRV